MLDQGADVNLQTSSGSTALHRVADGFIAAHEGWFDTAQYYAIVQMLLRNGADERVRNRSGQTPRDLEQAAYYPERREGMFWAAEEAREERYEAFAMGQLDRVGAESFVQDLDAGVVRIILEL